MTHITGKSESTVENPTPLVRPVCCSHFAFTKHKLEQNWILHCRYKVSGEFVCLS